MFRLLHLANPNTPLDAPFVMLAGSRWILRDYDQPSDAPPYSCISYAWQDGRVDHSFDPGQWMSARTVPALEATITATRSVETWSKSVQFSYKGDAAEEEAGRDAAMEAAQALYDAVVAGDLQAASEVATKNAVARFAPWGSPFTTSSELPRFEQIDDRTSRFTFTDDGPYIDCRGSSGVIRRCDLIQP